MPLDSANAYQHITVHPFAGSMGAEIRGADLASLTDAVFAEIKAAWLDHQVVFFRDQTITPEQQIAFAHRFGEIHHHPFMKGMDAYPDILEIKKEPTDTFTFGSAWHTDQMFNPKPAMATMLYAHEVPSAGGDTMYANMYDAYDALSDGMKTMLADVKGWCVGSKAADRGARYGANPDMASKVRDPGDLQTESAHPIVRTHPETGRKALYVGSHVKRFDGFTEAESDGLLKYLKAHSIRPEFTCRVNWKPGTLTLWDNRCVQHYAVPDYKERRRMHRITICGDVPF
ncbi:MAG: TauD/TfdA family dioxygenase [Alphaproteobacteria bacterium]|nr:TauD/TfdA family dioxygenase [Alphaproteobacteria bacterium]MCB9928299.1 TauD/TfdA family dioxygenase [Alphaproteobacteria bacterium]